jgi:ribosomal protein S18 acetylase RimI-like enzyme
MIEKLYSLNSEIILIVNENHKKHILTELLKNKNIYNYNKSIYYYQTVPINIIVKLNNDNSNGIINSINDFFSNKNTDSSVLFLSAKTPLISLNTMKNFFDILETDDIYQSAILTRNNKECVNHEIVITDINNQFIKITKNNCNYIKNNTLINVGIYSFKLKTFISVLNKLNLNHKQENFLVSCLNNIRQLQINNNNYNNIAIINSENMITNVDETISFNTSTNEQIDDEYFKNFKMENILDSKNNLSYVNINNLLKVLKQLSSGCDPINMSLCDSYRTYIKNMCNPDTINKKIMLVIKFKNNIIGTGSVLIENKIIHELGSVAHIEDIVIDSEYRGMGLASVLMNELIKLSKMNNCYKIILDASNDVKPFYKKLGFKDNATNMRLNLI